MKDFVKMQTDLNNEIISEVKAALSKLPNKSIEWEHKTPLCRIIASPFGDYNPKDLAVTKAWIDEKNLLKFNVFDANSGDNYCYDEEDELHEITDFGYLIEQIEEKLK